MGGTSPPTMTRPGRLMVIRSPAASESAISHRSSPAPETMKSTDFNLLEFIESQQRGGLIGNAKTENQSLN
jgi:hypothetical protein